jgi:hypothetical protein
LISAWKLKHGGLQGRTQSTRLDLRRMQRNPKHECGEGKVTLLKTKLVIHSALGGIVPLTSQMGKLSKLLRLAGK